MNIAALKLSLILLGLSWLLKFQAWRHPAYRERLKEKNLTAQFIARDEEIGRWFKFEDGRITSGGGVLPNADVTVGFKNAAVGAGLLMPPINWLDQINAQKEFLLTVDGDDGLANWFAQTVMMAQSVGFQYGTKMPDGSMRYCNMTNGGPVFVTVKDGKIVRMTPIDFDDTRPAALDHRGEGPEAHAAAQDHACAARSERQVDRLFAGPAALSDEARRLRSERRAQSAKPRQVRLRAHLVGRGADHRLERDQAAEARARARRHRGVARLAPHLGQHRLLPLGAVPLHQRGRHDARPPQSRFMGGLVLGRGASLGPHAARRPVGDLRHRRRLPAELRHDRVLGGGPGNHVGLLRRAGRHRAPAVAEEPKLGIKVVHVDPYYNASAQFLPGKWFAPKPTTSPAMAMAIAYVWIKEGLYDKEYVKTHTVGFDKWAAYLTGEEDGIAKTPEWQEKETGVPARDVRALAREWGSKRVYLAPGGWGNGHGGACRNQTGIQWARVMVCLSAMQGLGKPGCNMGNLQWGCPIDFNFYFPGYSEGGMSGDLENTAMPVALYQRMPQLPSMNSNGQQIPRIWLPEAIYEGKAEGYRWVGKSIEHQFGKFVYPAPGHSPVHMLYKYGGSILSTMNNSNRHVRMYQSEQLEFVVNQSIWFEGEAKFADVILPACTNFERTDISDGRGSAATAITASSSSTTASSSSSRRRSSRSANRSPTSGSSTRSASGSASPITSPRAATRSTGSSAPISPPTCRR